MVAKLKSNYGSGIEPLTHLGQNYMIVDRSLIPEILQVLRNEEEFDYCVDITAVHYPKRERQFAEPMRAIAASYFLLTNMAK